jgi:hypothetical protein
MAYLNQIPMLNGTNFKQWETKLKLLLGMMQYDQAIRSECPKAAASDGVATPLEKADIEKWQHNDRMCLMVIKSAIQDTLQGCIPDQESGAKEYLKALEEKFTKSKKNEVGMLLHKLVNTKYKGKLGIREHFTEMVKVQRALKEHGQIISDELLIDYIFMSLPSSYSQFRLTYNCIKEIWTLTEFEAQLVQEEERQKMSKGEEAHVVATDSNEKKRKRKNRKGKGPNKAADNNDAKRQKKDNTSEKSEDKVICYFCKKPGHIKRHCANHQAWLAKKGMCYGLVCSEVNLSTVSRYSWWLDSGATSNISISEQGCLNLRKPTKAERYIYVGNGEKVEVEGIGKFRLLCRTGFYLYFDALVVPSFRRNLISIFYLDKNGFVCSFSNGNFSLFQNSKQVAISSLSSYNNLYFLDIDTSHTCASTMPKDVMMS